jgi:hypothetical protein
MQLQVDGVVIIYLKTFALSHIFCVVTMGDDAYIKPVSIFKKKVLGPKNGQTHRF